MLTPEVDRAFDLSAVLQLSVGPTWSSLPTDQQSTLLAAFRRYTVANYVNNFDNYNGQSFDIQPDTKSLPNGEQRTFLADGDEVILTGRCEAPGRVGIGFGQCSATLRPARD